MRSWLCLVLLMHEWQSSEKMGQRAWPTGILAPPTSASHFTEFVLQKGVGTFVHQDQKVHIYKEYHSVCPFVGIGTLPPSLSSECAQSPPLPQNLRGEGAHSPAGEGLGESQFRRMEKKLSTLTTLWSGQNGTENLAQRALNWYWRARLSRGRVIWVLARPLPLSKFDRRRTGRMRKRDYLLTGKEGRGWTRRKPGLLNII